MRTEFSYKLLISEKEEGVLTVNINYGAQVKSFFVNIMSYARNIEITKDMLNIEQKYFYEKKILRVQDFSSTTLNYVIYELVSSGDIFEIMQPLNDNNE